MNLTVLKPGETVLEAEVKQVTLPGEAGELTPMDGHDRMLTVLKEGRFNYLGADEESGKLEEYEIGGGVAEIRHDAITIFVKHAKRVQA